MLLNIMGLFKSKSEPSVLKSSESVEEINSSNQKRLEARRIENAARSNYLFGTPRPLVKTKKVHFRTGPVVDTPHFVYNHVDK